MNNKGLLSILGIGSFLIWFFAVSYYDKSSAVWGGWHVILVSIIVSVILNGILIGIVMVIWGELPIPFIVIGIAALGFLSGVPMGISMTEIPVSEVQEVPAGVSVNETNEVYVHSRGGIFYYNSFLYSSPSSSGSTGSVSAPSCSGKSCEGLGIVLLVLFFIALMIGSAFIQHFWVLTALTWSIFLILLMVREYVIVQEYSYKKGWN